MQNRKKGRAVGPVDQMGTVLIVDISGFTKFVHEVDYIQGSRAIIRLLKMLMEANELGLRVSEIEGDAILYYLPGPPVSPLLLKRQFEAMINRFWDSTRKLSRSLPQASNLSIKMVAHYGRIIEFSLKGFRKLYGEAVIEAHRLLKNKVDSNTYILVTEKLSSFYPEDICQDPNVLQMCEIYDFGSICYSYLQYHLPSQMTDSIITPKLNGKLLNMIQLS